MIVFGPSTLDQGSHFCVVCFKTSSVARRMTGSQSRSARDGSVQLFLLSGLRACNEF
jgi:hypothetical protein